MNYKQFQLKMNSFPLLLLVFIFYLKSSQSMRVVPVNLKLSNTDCQDIFGTADLKKIPPYEFVRIKHTIDTSNSEKYVKFFAFNQMVELRLQKSTLFSRKTPIWLASTNQTGVQYSRVPPNTLGDALDLYEDPINKASMNIKMDSDGDLEFAGYIRDSFILRKLPRKLHKVWSRDFSESEHHREARNSKFYNFTDYHIVTFRSISDEVSMKSRNISRLQKKSMQIIPTYPFQLYFRTLIFVNFREPHTIYEKYFFYEFLIYLVCFWNAVNMKFDNFRNPSIKLHIAGIVMRNQTAPYLDDFMWINPDNEHSEQSIGEFDAFLKRNDPMPGRWDIAVSQSDYPLSRSNIYIGLAYFGTSCPIVEGSSTIPALALIFDKQDFKGVEVAAHEIGHLFGAQHDGEGSSRCNIDGFIMSSYSDWPKYESSSWSECSRMEILRRIRNRADSCWTGRPSIDEDDQVPQLLPGHITGVHDQCISRGFEFACGGESSTCRNLFCWSQKDKFLFGECEDAGPPLPGTYCGEYMHCKNQTCSSQTNA